MRLLNSAAIILVLTALSAAVAQNPPVKPVCPTTNNAINGTGGNNPGAPVKGANSFTEGQAKSRIEARGYTQVKGLQKDDSGVWRGTVKDGSPPLSAWTFKAT